MISWRKYVDTFDDDGITLSVDAHDIRFSYLQPDEVLLARDLMDRQIVDTQGLKVVRVNDLKLSQSGTQLRLLGAEVGVRGILRGLHPLLEKAVVNMAKLFHKKVDEQLIAWNYMDLLDRDLSEVQLSVTHRRLDELHPADVADILEQLDPQQRASVFAHLDDSRATEAISEMEDEYQAEFIDDLPTPGPPSSSATWTPTTPPTSYATFPTRRPRPFCALWAWKTPRKFAGCSATRTVPRAA